MLEKYKYTGKHRADNESLKPVAEVIEKASLYSEADTEPIPVRPTTSAEVIEQAESANVAFQEVLAEKDGTPEQSIRNIDLAIKHFGKEQFDDEEKAVLAEIVVEKSNEIIHKPSPDFTDPFTLGSAVDTLHELDMDTNNPTTQPILKAIINVSEALTEVRSVDENNNETVTIKLNPEEAAAVVKSVKKFEHLPDGHHEQLLDLIVDSMRRVTDDHLRGKPRKSTRPINPESTAAMSASDLDKVA